MTKANRKKIAKELLAAADRIETEEDVLCFEVLIGSEAGSYFVSLFQEDSISAFVSMDISEYDLPLRLFQEEIKSRRILALCWAALMAEEGVF